MARPSDYSEELATAICDRLASGEPLSKICADEAMPGRTTVYAWRHAHPEFQNKYARAREASADVWAERALQAAISANPMTAVANRLQFDGLRWYASKLAPRTYGDKTQHANAAGDADPTLHITYSWAVTEESEPSD